ncbi:MAG: N-acetyltransferase [bacterium]
MNIETVPVKNEKQLKQFIKLPWKIYRNDPYWVAPLLIDMRKMFNRKKNPFFQHSEAELFLALNHGVAVGRIAAIINNNHNKYHHEKTGFFGFFESIHDARVATELLSRAQTWVEERGMDTLRGPMNFSTNETCGFLAQGFDSSPVLMMPYNPEYYLGLMENFGLRKTKELLAYYFDRDMPIPDRFARFAQKTLQDKSVHFRTLNLKDVWNEVERIQSIYNEAWSNNWGFVPMTDAEFKHMAKELKPIADPDIVYIAEVNGELAGFSLALPDYNQILKKINGRLLPFGIFKLLWNRKKINRIRVITLGVKQKFQKKRGLAPTFYYETYTRGKKKGYALAEFSWILEDNVLMNRALQGLGAKLYKKYVIYEKSLD